jgi:hypothetical protein
MQLRRIKGIVWLEYFHFLGSREATVADKRIIPFIKT